MRHNKLTWLSLCLAASFPLSALAQEADNSFVTTVSSEKSPPASTGGDENMVADQNGMDGDQGGMDGGHGQHRADRHNPAFVMFSHVHEAGEWTIGYRYSETYMRGNQTGTTSLSTSQALNFYPVPPGVPGTSAFMMVPLDMTMEMHMMPIMRAITDDLTLYLMPTWMCNTMDMQNRMGAVLRTTNEGFSDLPFGALWRIFQGDDDELIVNAGFSARRVTSTTSIRWAWGCRRPSRIPCVWGTAHGTPGPA